MGGRLNAALSVNFLVVYAYTYVCACSVIANFIFMYSLSNEQSGILENCQERNNSILQFAVYSVYLRNFVTRLFLFPMSFPEVTEN